MQPTNCLNCHAAITPSQQFCPQCGQKTAVHRFSFHELLHELIHYFTHADKGIFTLLKALAVQPGTVAREYLAGARKKYFSPFNIFFIVAGILVFMTSMFHKIDESRVKQMEEAALSIPNPVQKQKLLAMANRVRNTNTYSGKYSNVINMIATPLTTVFWWLFYRRKYNYVEHLIANMYFISPIMLVYALVFVPLLKWSLSPAIVFGLLALFFLFECIYRSIAYYQFINKKGTLPYLKALGISVLLVLFWAGGTAFVLFYYIKHGF